MLKTMQLILGFYPRRVIKNIQAIPWYLRTRKKFLKQTRIGANDFPLSGYYPCLTDKDEEGGIASGHYFHQDLLVSQEVFKRSPQRHVDIGSRINGFVAQVASYREIEVMDIRNLTSDIPNLKFVQADCMVQNSDYENYSDSVSSLHAIEHFGLGRYGDTIDIEGHLKGLDFIYRMLKPDGIFYFSVPIGQQRVEFNAHRVFSIVYLLGLFKDKYTIESFSYVDDKGDLHKNASLTNENINNNFNCTYGCGIFILRKN